MKNLSRLLTAAVCIPLIYILVIHSSVPVFVVVLQIALLLTLGEFYSISKKAGYKPEAVAGSILALLLCLSFYNFNLIPGFYLPLLIACSVFLIPVIYIIRKKELNLALGSVSITCLGILMFGFVFGYQILLRREPERGAGLIFFLYFVIWMGDAAAFYFGSYFGNHKISKRVSPNKTWEGALASFCTALLSALIVHLWFAGMFSLLQALAVGALLNITGQSGDMIESMFKRSASVEDSSTLLPGHGGMLDRLDSVMFAAPVLYYCDMFVK